MTPLLSIAANNTQPIKNMTFNEILIYQNTAVSMVNDTTKPNNPPIVAFADQSCNIPGKLSIIKYSNDYINSDNSINYQYIAQCISNKQVYDIVLKRAHKNNGDYLYVSYIEGHDIKLKETQLSNDSNNWSGVWTDYNHSDQLTANQLVNKNPINIDLAIDSNGNPDIVYTSGPDNNTQMFELQYINDTKGFNANNYIGNGTTTGERIHTAYDSHDNLFIAYLNAKSNIPDIVELTANNHQNWHALNNNLSHNTRWLGDEAGCPNSFNIVMYQDKILLTAMTQEDIDNEDKNITHVYLYDTNSPNKNYTEIHQENIGVIINFREFQPQTVSIFTDNNFNIYLSYSSYIGFLSHDYKNYITRVGTIGTANATHNFQEYAISNPLDSSTTISFLPENVDSKPSNIIGYSLMNKNGAYKVFIQNQ